MSNTFGYQSLGRYSKVWAANGSPWQCLPLLSFSFVCLLGPQPNWQHPFALAEPVPCSYRQAPPLAGGSGGAGADLGCAGPCLTISMRGGGVKLASIQRPGAFVQM